MHELRGLELLQFVAERIISRYLKREGMTDISVVSMSRRNGHGDGVDLTYSRLGRSVRVKVKADPYYGLNPSKSSDMSLPFYRADSGEYALEVVAHHVTRDPGWMFRTDAEELFYYCLAIDSTEEEVAAAASMPDDGFFSGIEVVRDALFIMPVEDVRVWFARHHEEFSSRPVRIGSHSAWYRIIPRNELTHAVGSIVEVGPIFER